MADIEVPGGSATPDNPKGAQGRPPHAVNPADYEPAVEPGENPMAPAAGEERSAEPPLPTLTDRPAPRFPAQADQGPEPSFLDVAAAAERQGNIASELVDPIERAFGVGSPEAPVAADPGYNPIDHIPPGYLHRYGHLYMHTGNPAQAEELTQEIQQRERDGGIIARAGGMGFAAVTAAGLTDPVNAAAMAIVPEAATTRLGNAVRWSLTNAAMSAAQEGLWSEIDPTRSKEGAAISIGASALLGGVLGPLAPRVPASLRASMAENLARELRVGEPTQTEIPTIHAIDGEGVHTVQSANGTTTARQRGDSLQILSTETAEGARGGGENPARIARMADEARDRGLTLTSDTKVAASAAKAYDRLEERGYTVTRNPAEPDGEGNLVSTAGRPVFEVRPPPEESRVMGTAQRSVADELDSHLAGLEEAGFKDGYIPPVEEERVPPRYVPPRPEGPTLPRPGVIPEIEPHRMSLGEAIAVTKGADAETHGLSFNEAIAQGLDRADLRAARFGNRPMFTKGGASFDAMAEALHQHGYPVVDEKGNYSPNALLDSLDRELHGKKQYSEAAGDYLSQILEHERLSEQAERTPTAAEADLEHEARVQAAKEVAKARITAEAEHALPGEPMYVNPEMESTAGAMAVHGGRLADLDVARGGKLYSKTVGRVSVAARLMESKSPAVRRLTTELLNLPGTLEMHYNDVRSPNPIERILWQEVDAKQAGAIAKMNEQFGKYRTRVKEEGGAAMDRESFESAWAHAQRHGDKSSVPEVAEYARWHRDNILEPYRARADAAGIFPEEGKGLFADSYLNRLYDIPKIRADKSGWLNLLTKHFMKEGVEDRIEARQIAHDVDRNITANERGTMNWHALDGIVPKSGRLKARALTLHDDELAPYLSTNHSELTRAYLHSIVPEVNMVERFGTRDLADQFQGIRDEYTHLIELAQGDSGKIRGLEKARDSELKLLGAARDQLYGIYGVPQDPSAFFVRAGRFLRGLNIGRMLGGATFKHFPDAANVIQAFGAPQTVAVMAKLATSLDAIKMGYAEAKRMGASIDMVMNLSSSRLWDAPAHSTFPEQRFLNKFNRFFTIATLETPLITATQSIASVAGQDQILRLAEQVAAGRVLPKNRAAALAAAGLDTGMLERIAAAHAVNGREINGLKFGMSEQWSDKEAARAFESAVIRDAHGVTMRPGIGDKPLFMSKEWGKFVFQFKSFEFAASRIVGLPMLQGLAHGDARAVQALFAQFAMATLGYVAYQKATGGKVETNPAKLIVELMDRTNLTGWTGSVIFPALYQLGFKDMTRWYDKDPISSIGPSAELLKELMDRQLPGRLEQAVGGRAPGQQPLGVRRSDLHFMRKLAPANQVWYARRAVDKMEDAIGDAFYLPGESLEARREKDNQVAQPGPIQ